MSRNYFILHGHFYQPPRENPWTGFIDRQESAYPYTDWNTRINAECYAACTRTPVLENNEIIKIINCFEYLSFNIGPTLLSWMEKQEGDRNTVQKIIEGDRISYLRNGGHGNAIAQVYSHMIMPLAGIKDQYTQIIWGLQDFKMRFGRNSEGIWLGETAINNETAAILVDCGIKYVILSPFQAGNIIVDMHKTNVKGGKVDTTKPYNLQTKNGRLAVFFYNPHLASEISFGDVLGDAQRFSDMIKQEFFKQSRDINLVHTATDGEVYGHHKSFGNMALAKLIYNATVTQNTSFEFTNYGHFLELYPPTEECELFLGDLGEGSSWSCIHGVSRWIRDCGCHTGGQDSWNQQWRTPLRNAFDLLRDHLYQVAESVTKSLLKDLWDARNDYFLPMVKRDAQYYQDFFLKHQKKELSLEERQNVLQIMESLRYAMLMYTSCGWFFSDLSGIETIQDLLYAVRAYEFSKEFLDISVVEQFVDTLSQARSNIFIDLNGGDILNNSIVKYKISNTSLIEYICWLTLSKGGNTNFLETNEFSINILYVDLKKRCFVIDMVDTVGEEFKIVCVLDISKSSSIYTLLWKKINSSITDYEDTHLWNLKDNTWKLSQLTNLPLFLRIRFLSQHTQLDTNGNSSCYEVDDNVFFLNAVWDVENILLPYEKEILNFHFISQIHKFADNIMHQASLSEIEFFIKEIELLKNVIVSQEEMGFYLEPLIRVLDKFLQKTLQQNSAEMLRYARMLFWSVKIYMDPVRLDILRNLIYHFSTTELRSVKDPTFLVEYHTLMRDMGFLVKQ
ncbi:MAG: DUF3536 domain-containing protein [Brevinema sp.]